MVQTTNILKPTKRKKIVGVGKSDVKQNEYLRRIYIIAEKRILKNTQKTGLSRENVFLPGVVRMNSF